MWYRCISSSDAYWWHDRFQVVLFFVCQQCVTYIYIYIYYNFIHLKIFCKQNFFHSFFVNWIKGIKLTKRKIKFASFKLARKIKLFDVAQQYAKKLITKNHNLNVANY